FVVELAVLLEGRNALDHIDHALRRDEYVGLGRFRRQRALGNQRVEYARARLRGVEKLRVEILSEHFAHPIEALPLRIVELLRGYRVATHLCNGAFALHETVVTLDAEKHERGKHQKHQEKHQPATVATDGFEHAAPFRGNKGTRRQGLATKKGELRLASVLPSTPFQAAIRAIAGRRAQLHFNFTTTDSAERLLDRLASGAPGLALMTCGMKHEPRRSA